MSSVSAKQMALALKKMSDKGKDISGLFAWLEDIGKLHMLPKIAEELKKIRAEENEENIVHIETANPCGEKDDLCKKVATIVAKKADASYDKSVNPNIIGGFVATYGNKSYDASLKRRIEKLKRYLLNK